MKFRKYSLNGRGHDSHSHLNSHWAESALCYGEGREVAETCIKTACSACNEREGPQMPGHHKPLLSRQPCRTDPQPCQDDPSSPIPTLPSNCIIFSSNNQEISAKNEKPVHSGSNKAAAWFHFQRPRYQKSIAVRNDKASHAEVTTEI